MNTKSSGWCGNRRFKDRGSKLSYGIVGTRPEALTNGQAYPALLHFCTWFSGFHSKLTWSPLSPIIILPPPRTLSFSLSILYFGWFTQ